MDTLLLNARTIRKQPTGIENKYLVSKMLTICSLFVHQASCDERNAVPQSLSRRRPSSPHSLSHSSK
jgi:hypothetical protein